MMNTVVHTTAYWTTKHKFFLFFLWSTNISFFMHIKNLIRTYLVQIGDNFSKWNTRTYFARIQNNVAS